MSANQIPAEHLPQGRLMDTKPTLVDTSGLETAVDNAIAEIDWLREVNAELLAALKLTTARLSMLNDGSVRGVVAKGRAAIAKADAR